MNVLYLVCDEGQSGLFLRFNVKLVSLMPVLSVPNPQLQGPGGKRRNLRYAFHHEIFKAQASSGYVTYFCLLELFT